MPCQLEVRTDDLRPVKVNTPFPVEDGRYKLLAPAWTADIVRVNGAWEISNLKPHQPQELSPAERLVAEKKIDKDLAHDSILRSAAKAALARSAPKPGNDPPKQKRRKLF